MPAQVFVLDAFKLFLSERAFNYSSDFTGDHSFKQPLEETKGSCVLPILRLRLPLRQIFAHPTVCRYKSRVSRGPEEREHLTNLVRYEQIPIRKREIGLAEKDVCANLIGVRRRVIVWPFDAGRPKQTEYHCPAGPNPVSRSNDEQVDVIVIGGTSH